MGRLLRSTVPTTRAQREPSVPDLTAVRAQDQQNKARQKRNYDAHHGAKELPPLKQKQREGEVRDEVAPQSYNVDSEGDTIRRNRRDLICLPDAETVATPEEPSEQMETEPGEQAQMNNAIIMKIRMIRSTRQH